MAYSNMAKEEPVAVVLGLGITGLGVIRNLGREGVPCIGVDPSRITLGKFSRYCKAVLSPDIDKSEEGFLVLLMQIGEKMDLPGVIFPTEDRYVSFVDKYREKLGRYYRFPLPDSQLCKKILNKYDFFELAKKNSFAVPATFYIKNNDDLKAIVPEIRFPCIIKPLYSKKWSLGSLIKAVEVGSVRELLEEGGELARNNNGIAVQEIVVSKDRDQFSFAAYFDLNGNYRAGFVARKVRQHPLDFGVGTLVESVHEPRVEQLGRDVLKKLGFKGIAEVEFRKDEKDGGLKLIEINIRPWTQSTLASSCGLNLIYFAYLDMIGRSTPVGTAYKNGIKWVNLLRDPIASFQYIARHDITLSEWTKSLMGIKEFSVLAFDDILPFLCLPLYLAAYFIRKKE